MCYDIHIGRWLHYVKMICPVVLFVNLFAKMFVQLA